MLVNSRHFRCQVVDPVDPLQSSGMLVFDQQSYGFGTFSRKRWSLLNGLAPWGPMGPAWGPWDPHGTPMGAQGTPMGSPWGPMRTSMGAHGPPMGPNGTPWGLMGPSWSLCGAPCARKGPHTGARNYIHKLPIHRRRAAVTRILFSAY